MIVVLHWMSYAEQPPISPDGLLVSEDATMHFNHHESGVP